MRREGPPVRDVAHHARIASDPAETIALLDHVRWCWDVEDQRFARARELCLAIVATNGVVLALLLGDEGLDRLTGWMWLPSSFFFLSTAVATLGIWPRKASNQNLENFVGTRRQMKCRPGATSDVNAGILDILLLPLGEGESPLISQRKRASFVLDCAGWAVLAFAMALLSTVLVAIF